MNKHIMITILISSLLLSTRAVAVSTGEHAEMTIAVENGLIKGTLKNISSNTVVKYYPDANDNSIKVSRAIKVQYKRKNLPNLSALESRVSVRNDIRIPKKGPDGNYILRDFVELQPQTSVEFKDDVNSMGRFLRMIGVKVEDIEKVRFSVHVFIANNASDTNGTEYVVWSPWYTMSRIGEKGKYVLGPEVQE